MRPFPRPRLAALLLALALLLAACGSAAPPPDPRPPAEAPPAVQPAAAVQVDLERLASRVAALPGAVELPPDPAVPAPAVPPGEAKPFTPRLTGRAADGTGVVDFGLVHTRVVAQVSGNVARVEVTQYYANPSPDRLEAVYAFPLPPNAAVTDMAFRIGDRVIRSEVKRRAEAKRTYEAAKREGKAAALTEQERPNLFTQSVANVPPGETVAVVLRYVHEVPYDDGRYLFHFPTTIGPRYVPGAPLEGSIGPGRVADTDQVPDASRVTPPVVPPGLASAHDVDLVVRLVPAGAFTEISSRSHAVVTGQDGDARVVALAEGDRAPNRDFVLAFRPAGDAPGAHALVQREHGEDFLLLFLQPPAEVTAAQVRPKELVFLLDKSGSMSGPPLDRATALVSRALDALAPADTFQLVAFDGAAQAMTPAPVLGTPEHVADAKAWLARLAGGGGTEMLEGIRAALTPPEDPRRLRMVVFCTDGFIGNEPEIIDAVEALRGSARVFGFGIGSSVNRFLVEGVARAGRGAAEVVALDEAPDGAVDRLFRRLDRPVLTDLEVDFEGAQVTDLLPARLPDLFAGQPLVIAARVAGGVPTHARLRGLLGEQPWAARVAVAAAQPADPGLAQPVAGTLWARRRVDALLSARFSDPAPEAVEEIVALALRFRLVTTYTSFVAVEHAVRLDPGLPLARALVPNELPAGVSYEGALGQGTEIAVLPARVKPGDPELRVTAAPGTVAVRVALPFEARAREASPDPARGDWVLRFLVPPAWPDGSFDARVTIVHASGAEEERVAPIRVDTTPAAIAVLSAPERVAPGETIRLLLKPALPLERAPALLGRPGGLGHALKGAMEVKEVLVRAPWGETVRARMEGPLGAWVAILRAPPGSAAGAAELELAASDAAGNVSRRRLPIVVAAAPTGAAPLEAGVAAVAFGAAGVLLLALAIVAAAVAVLRERPGPPPLAHLLLAGTVRRAGGRSR